MHHCYCNRGLADPARNPSNHDSWDLHCMMFGPVFKF
jgi:hypothetical protein